MTFKNVTLVDHPVVARDLTVLRNCETPPPVFRSALSRIAIILAYNSLKGLPLKKVEVETPIQKTDGYEIDTDVVVVSILRAGLGLVDAVMQFIPEAKIGHLGMYRDEITHQPVDYYSKIPENIKQAQVLLVDPMLATGGSATDSITFLKRKGAKNIRFMCLISAPEGIKRVQDEHPDISIITAAIDERLNDDAFIVPGLGDAGDRIFGTI
ncbi:uracil phosphoribosyltransferase [Natronogracilivirga saccharolytica]|uniref:Uracil phosphoribosyltransferase n=1 Tax=Natronogracilivirga saccharolytica TaxID=2812953 RepID=A0A8J7RID1_9BACT|nr:uracil phosphoribosyltransferase [Natronogracilivirga saccharolytica]MBP3192340.1 uracil phosphoribosyltransferase [Natronogracilivirga saccharolytica]